MAALQPGIAPTGLNACRGHRFTGMRGQFLEALWKKAREASARFSNIRRFVKVSTHRPAQGRGCTMIESVKQPEDCATMADVRAGVDALDRELMRLLSVRFGYMRAAARIKPERGHVRDEGRKAEVVDNVRKDAREAGIPEEALAEIWDRLVETSIAYEMVEWERLRS